MPIRRERSDAAENRRLILQTAQSLFAQYGVSEVSMHQIAKTAGIGQGTLYRRYAHKGDLCSDLMEDNSRAVIHAIEGFLKFNADKLSPRELLGGTLDLMIDFIDDKAQLLIPLHNVYMCEDDSSAFFRSPIYNYLLETLSSLLRRIGEEESAGAADPVFTGHVILCAMNPIGYLHLLKDRGMTKEDVKRHCRRLYAGI